MQLRARRIGGIDEGGNAGHAGDQLAQELQPLRHQFADDEIDAGEVTSGSREAGHQSEPDGVLGHGEHDWNGRGRRLDGDGWSGSAMRDDDRDLPANKIGRQPRQPVELVLGPAVFDRDVLAFDIPCVLQALAKSAQAIRETLGRYRAEETDHRHRRLLRPRRERPRRRRAAE